MGVAININVSPNILEWVKTQVSSSMTAEISLLDKWISGKETPTVSKIRNISSKSHIPFGYFFLQKPPVEECSIMHCRTLNSSTLKNSSRELIDTFNSMLQVKDWMSEYKQRNKFIELPFVGTFKESDSPYSIADSIRDVLVIDKSWTIKHKDAGKAFLFLRKRISEIGIIVIQNSVVGSNTHRQLSVQEFRAFTLIDKYSPLIFINGKDSITAKVFSLAHELAHVLLGKDNLFNDHYFEYSNNITEKICNAVAAEIIVPEEFFYLEWEKNTSETKNKIQELAKIFCCSSLVIARRALDFNLITKEMYEQFSCEFRQNKNSVSLKKGHGNFIKTMHSRWDKNFILALDSSTKSGDTLFLDAYRLTGLKEKNFNELVADFQKAGE